MVGLGVDLEDITDYVGHNDVGTAVLLRAIARARHVAPRRARVEHGRLRRGPLPLRGARASSARARAPSPDLDAGRFEPPCPRCGRPLAPEAVAEDAPLDPRNVYAATKLHQEHLARRVRARDRRPGRRAALPQRLRPADAARHAVRGRRGDLLARALAAGRAPQVLEDGGQLRDFVHVRDVARANVLALTAEEPASGAFNVCSGRPRSIADMARALHAAAGPGAPGAGGRRRVPARRRPARLRRPRAGRQRVLGFTAREDFAAGMAELAGA